MSETFAEFIFFGVVISLGGYEIGLWLKRKWKLALFNFNSFCDRVFAFISN